MFGFNHLMGGLVHQIPSTVGTAFQVFMELFSEKRKNKATKNESQDKLSISSKNNKN